MAANQNHITWSVQNWQMPAKVTDGIRTDQTDINAALATFRTLVATLPAKYRNVQLEAFQEACDQVCLSSDECVPLQFVGFKSYRSNPSEGVTTTMVQLMQDGKAKWFPLDDDREGFAIPTMNEMPTAERSRTKFLIKVTYGTTGGGLVAQGFNEASWLETTIHEVAIHVVAALGWIRTWRRGGPWLKFDDGELDHLLFRHLGTPMYIWLCNEIPSGDLPAVRAALNNWNKKEAGRYVNLSAAGAIRRVHNTVDAREGKRPTLNFEDAWMIAIRFNPEFKTPEELGLFTQTDHPDYVDVERSLGFLKHLLQQVDPLDLSNDGKALQWWDEFVKGKSVHTTSTASGPGHSSTSLGSTTVAQIPEKEKDDKETKGKAPEKAKEEPTNKNESEKKEGEGEKKEEHEVKTGGEEEKAETPAPEKPSQSQHMQPQHTQQPPSQPPPPQPQHMQLPHQQATPAVNPPPHSSGPPTTQPTHVSHLRQ